MNQIDLLKFFPDNKLRREFLESLSGGVGKSVSSFGISTMYTGVMQFAVAGAGDFDQWTIYPNRPAAGLADAVTNQMFVGDLTIVIEPTVLTGAYYFTATAYVLSATAAPVEIYYFSNVVEPLVVGQRKVITLPKFPIVSVVLDARSVGAADAISLDVTGTFFGIYGSFNS